MIIRDSINLEKDVDELIKQLEMDKEILEDICQTCYLQGHSFCIPKQQNISLAWKYAQNPADYQCFMNMLCVSPQVFQALLHLIEDHAFFQNNSKNCQTPVEIQLAVPLYCMGHFGNGASLEDIARVSGGSEGSVENCTEQCFRAIEDLHYLFVRP